MLITASLFTKQDALQYKVMLIISLDVYVVRITSSIQYITIISNDNPSSCNKGYQLLQDSLAKKALAHF